MIATNNKSPAGWLPGSKYTSIRPKGPCGTTFSLKIQFCPPKKPLRDDFLAQMMVLSAQKAPAGRISSPKHNLICPKAPCGTTFCYSQSEIYDIGTEFFIFHCFATKIIKSFYESMIPVRICTDFWVDSESAIKTIFKALFLIDLLGFAAIFFIIHGIY